MEYFFLQNKNNFYAAGVWDIYFFLTVFEKGKKTLKINPIYRQ